MTFIFLRRRRLVVVASIVQQMSSRDGSTFYCKSNFITSKFLFLGSVLLTDTAWSLRSLNELECVKWLSWQQVHSCRTTTARTGERGIWTGNPEPVTHQSYYSHIIPDISISVMNAKKKILGSNERTPCFSDSKSRTLIFWPTDEFPSFEFKFAGLQLNKKHCRTKTSGGIEKIRLAKKFSI